MNKKNAGLGFPVFFLVPWLGFVLSLQNLRSKTSAFVYIAFAMLFGYAISFADSSADSYRYAQSFARFDNTLDYNILVYMYRTGELRDLYRVLLFYFTSIFSTNPKVMYAFAGLVYGVFSYLSFTIFVKERGEKWDQFVVILALVFYTYISLANINGFRFWTGAMLFFYATYNFIILKRSIWVLGILATPLFHYGFMLAMPLMILYRFIHPLLYNDKSVSKNLYYFFIIAFMASWVLGTNSINLGFLSQVSSLSGEVGNRMEYVNSEDITNLVDNRRENSLFLGVQQYFLDGIKIYVFIVVLFLHKQIKKMAGNKKVLTNLLAFVLFFYTFAFIANSFPSGGRFMNIAHLFFIILLVKFYSSYQTKNIKIVISWALPVFSFNIAFTNFMLPLLILSPTFWYGNLFWIIIEGLDFLA
jgi:hypothetical protein